MRKRLSYANVVATLALVFAMSGGAMAANHYLITSTKQINPKVLKKLTGKTGKTGAAGTTGAIGKEGPQGKEGTAGKEGPLGKEGAAGKEGKEGAAGSAIAYAHVLANGEVEKGSSKNITSANVTSPVTGVYCFKGLGFTPHNLVASIDWSSTLNGVIEEATVAHGANAKNLCNPEEAEAAVLTAAVKPGVFTEGISRAFYVSFN
jgi:hypothetical protein